MYVARQLCAARFGIHRLVHAAQRRLHPFLCWIEAVLHGQSRWLELFVGRFGHGIVQSTGFGCPSVWTGHFWSQFSVSNCWHAAAVGRDRQCHFLPFGLPMSRQQCCACALSCRLSVHVKRWQCRGCGVFSGFFFDRLRHGVFCMPTRNLFQHQHLLWGLVVLQLSNRHDSDQRSVQRWQ